MLFSRALPSRIFPKFLVSLSFGVCPLNPSVFPKEKENTASVYHMHEDKFSVLICPTAVIFTGNAKVSLGWANVERLRCCLLLLIVMKNYIFYLKTLTHIPK